ncbi:MAG: hypothetical protein EAX81_01175 [Candidatus Thorarchaeota archaeon]|nr:hypothetical protein [Candidatus Thorarchaeota archaeon]
MQPDFLYIPELAAVIPVVIPVATAILIAILSEIHLFARKKRAATMPAIIAILGFALTFIYVYYLGIAVWTGGLQTFTWPLDASHTEPCSVVMIADQFSVLLMGIFTVLGFVVSVYSIGYMKNDTGLPRYYMLLLIMVGAMNGVVVSGDLFTLFLFYETMSICSFILVAFRRTWEGLEASIKYLMMSAIGSTLVLLSASYLYGLTGTLNLGVMATAIRAGSGHPLIPILVALMTAGFGVKGAIVPFAAWLADAHPAAPSGISAMLSGVVIKVGIYGIVRMNAVLFPFEMVNWPLLLAIFAAVTMTAGNFYALTQTDLKRMLAYSSITQIGFILFAFAATPYAGTAFGYETGAFYVVVHAFTKGLLFLCAGAFLHAVGTRDLDALQGIGKKMPLTSAFFAIGVLSLMGMPPFAGFYAKLLILAAGVDAGLVIGSPYLLFTLVAVFNALLALGYYLRMLNVVWLKDPTENVENAHRSSTSMLCAMALLAIALVVIGVYPAPVYSIAEAAGSALFQVEAFITGITGALSP